MFQKLTPLSLGGGGGSLPLTLKGAVDSAAGLGLNSSGIRFDCWSNENNACTLYFYVDVTNIKKVTLDITVSAVPYSFTGQVLAITSTEPNTTVSETIVASTPISRTIGNAQYELDLSNYTGSYYVEVGVTAMQGAINSIGFEFF